MNTIATCNTTQKQGEQYKDTTWPHWKGPMKFKVPGENFQPVNDSIRAPRGAAKASANEIDCVWVVGVKLLEANRREHCTTKHFFKYKYPKL